MSTDAVQRCLIVIWLVPHETATVSVRSTSYNHEPCYVTSCKDTHVRCMCVYL